MEAIASGHCARGGSVVRTVGGGHGGLGHFGSSGRGATDLEKKDGPTIAKRMEDVGAGRGKRSPKSGQANYFVGYMKHSVYGLLRIAERWQAIPFHSRARPANEADVDMLMPLMQFVFQHLHSFWPVGFVIADRGYVSKKHSRRLREQWTVALILHPKKSMVPPKDSDQDGCPFCALGERLVWNDYDATDGTLIYRGNPNVCRCCPLAGTCPRQFEFDAKTHETFWGMVPYHSRLRQQLLRKFRPRIEPGFNSGKNRFRLKDFFINSQHLAESLCVMSDCLECLEILASQRPQRGRETRNALLGDINALELWD
jgi:hypothetical protein